MIFQDGGIAVMGHIGLTPQGISVLGGFRAQGRTAVKARKIIDDALAIQDAGAFALGLQTLSYFHLTSYRIFSLFIYYIRYGLIL